MSLQHVRLAIPHTSSIIKQPSWSNSTLKLVWFFRSPWGFRRPLGALHIEKFSHSKLGWCTDIEYTANKQLNNATIK